MGKKGCNKKPRCKHCPKRKKNKVERDFCPDFAVDREIRVIFRLSAG